MAKSARPCPMMSDVPEADWPAQVLLRLLDSCGIAESSGGSLLCHFMSFYRARQRGRERERDKETERKRDRGRERGRDRVRKIDRERERQTVTETHMKAKTETTMCVHVCISACTHAYIHTYVIRSHTYTYEHRRSFYTDTTAHLHVDACMHTYSCRLRWRQ